MAPSTAMASKQIVYMNNGQGETSYACNSQIQGGAQNKMKPPIEAAINELRSTTTSLLPAQMLIADLGCSSGPNALELVSVAAEAINRHCDKLQQPPPEVCLFLNDLPGNDFNIVVKSLHTLRQRSSSTVTTGVIPGSFYERLFTTGSMHLFCSSNSLHWLSEAPEVLRKNQIPAYDIDENVRRERLPIVIEAYAQQFRKDFKNFLKLRATELVEGGHMVLSLIGRRPNDSTSEFSDLWEIVAKILRAMASEGVIDKAKFESFYVPMYAPSDQELRDIIQEEGSFCTKDLMVHDLKIFVDKSTINASWALNQIRAVFEPIIVQHFGDVMDEFVRTAEQRWSQEGSLQDEFVRHQTVAFIMSLTKA
jgi:jasmonate O-methyltransferase